MSLAADVDLAIHQLRLREAVSGGHWVTVKGGAHLYISDGGASGSGTVLAGPKSFVGANIAHLPGDAEHHAAGHTPEGATGQADYHETDDAGGRKAANARHKGNRLGEYDADTLERNLHHAEAPGGSRADVHARASKLAAHHAAEADYYRTHPNLKFAASRMARHDAASKTFRAKADAAAPAPSIAEPTPSADTMSKEEAAIHAKIAKKGSMRAYHMTLDQIDLAKDMVKAGKLRVSGPRTDEVYSPVAAGDGDAPAGRTMSDARLRGILTAGGNAGKNPARKWGG